MTCSKCKKEKDTGDFKTYKNKKGLRIGPLCLDCFRESMRFYYKNSKHIFTGWKERNPGCASTIGKRYFSKLKMETISAYGGMCSCCGETEIRFLTIEHLWHDGKEHRKAVKKKVYLDLRKRGYPQDIGITVLCWCCNMATRFGGICPHKLSVQK